MTSWTSGQQIIVDVGGEPELWLIISEAVVAGLSLTIWPFDWEMKRLAEDGWLCLQATQRAALNFQNRTHVLMTNMTPAPKAKYMSRQDLRELLHHGGSSLILLSARSGGSISFSRHGR